MFFRLPLCFGSIAWIAVGKRLSFFCRSGHHSVDFSSAFARNVATSAIFDEIA